MKLSTLFGSEFDPFANSLVDDIRSSFRDIGCEQPTPLVSSFWKGTFTPSSSEIIFRPYLEGHAIPSTGHAIQPCVRVTDLARLNSGWHRLLFHMVTFFRWNLSEHKADIGKLLRTMTAHSGTELSEFIFTISTNPRMPSRSKSSDVGLDYELLVGLGVPRENIAFSSGSDNYQDTRMPTDVRKWVGMTGPKVEVYYNRRGVMREVATFQTAEVRIEGKAVAEVFAFAIGLERLHAIANNASVFQETAFIATTVDRLAEILLHPTMAKRQIGLTAVYELLLLVDALNTIAPSLAANDKTKDRGFKNHAKRIRRHFWRCAQAVGVVPLDICAAVENHFSVSLTPELRMLCDEESTFTLPDYVH